MKELDFLEEINIYKIILSKFLFIKFLLIIRGGIRKLN